jgi:hypothetical protein
MYRASASSTGAVESKMTISTSRRSATFREWRVLGEETQ